MGTVVSAQPVEELTALQAQCKAEALEEAKAAVVKPPKAWLDWEQCQQARLRSERAVASYKGANAAEKLALVRTCCVLKLFTALPPDRVRVYRELQLGGSLKPLDAGSYQIDLGLGAHKTCTPPRFRNTRIVWSS